MRYNVYEKLWPFIAYDRKCSKAHQFDTVMQHSEALAVFFALGRMLMQQSALMNGDVRMKNVLDAAEVSIA